MAPLRGTHGVESARLESRADGKLAPQFLCSLSPSRLRQLLLGGSGSDRTCSIPFPRSPRRPPPCTAVSATGKGVVLSARCYHSLMSQLQLEGREEEMAAVAEDWADR